MQVEATYHQGEVKFKRPMRFKYDGFPITVTIPDEAIIQNEASASLVKTDSDTAHLLLKRIQDVLGEHYHSRPDTTTEQDRASLLEALEEKYS